MIRARARRFALAISSVALLATAAAGCTVGDGTGESRVKLTIRPDKRVPAPKTPDKDTAE